MLHSEHSRISLRLSLTLNDSSRRWYEWHHDNKKLGWFDRARLSFKKRKPKSPLTCRQRRQLLPLRRCRRLAPLRQLLLSWFELSNFEVVFFSSWKLVSSASRSSEPLLPRAKALCPTRPRQAASEQFDRSQAWRKHDIGITSKLTIPLALRRIQWFYRKLPVLAVALKDW